MKRILLISMIFVSVMSSAQSLFTLIPSGFMATADTTKDFVVIPFEGKTQKQLYDIFLSKITTLYVSAKDVVSKVEDNTINIHAYTSKAVSFSSSYYYTLSYNISFLFKDGKVRVNAMLINYMRAFAGTSNEKNLYLCGNGGSSWFGTQYIFNKRGELKNKKAKAELETYFDALINNISKQDAGW